MSSNLVNLYHFKDITVVPGAKDLIDVVLSRTQRKTPTEVHKQFKITRIRTFYTRKIKFCQQTFHDKLTEIITQFPKLDDIHPFYADLCNVLYDRDHYKLALGQCNSVRSLLDKLANDYVRMTKYADSLYKCKMLKRAAIGRICTLVKKLQHALTYLEEVRQHLGRLPSINPNTRTLILTGYPNVGKSSFINNVSRANVEVQPYAFTTKSLFVGHFDYCYARWQILDTPGILDRPLEERNTIEMTAITAIAHITAAVLYIVDLSETCGYSIENQVKLFHSIKTVFQNKPLVIVLNKTDLQSYEGLSDTEKELIESMKLDNQEVIFKQVSTLKGDGVDACRNAACDALLDLRLSTKLSNKKANTVLDKLYVAEPKHVSNTRPAVEPIPKQTHVAADIDMDGTTQCRITEKDLQEQYGGPGVYSSDYRKNYLLERSDWKHDVIPEILDGKNIADFVDEDIEAKLKELEKEEAILLKEDPSLNSEFFSPDYLESRRALNELHKKINFQRVKNSLKKTQTKRVMARSKKITSAKEAVNHLASLGYDTTDVTERFSSVNKLTPRQRRNMKTLNEIAGKVSQMEELQQAAQAQKLSYKEKRALVRSKGLRTVGHTGKARKGWRTASLNKQKARKGLSLTGENAVNFEQLALTQTGSTNFRLAQGLRKASDQLKAEKLRIAAEQPRNKLGRKGEGDRHTPALKPKHLFSGKRKAGKTDWR